MTRTAFRGSVPFVVLATVVLMAPILATVTVPRAEARDMGSMGTLSLDNPVIEQEFPPIPAIYPFEGAHAFVYFRPPMCRQSVYCDALEFDVDTPRTDDEMIVRVTLTWPNYKERDTNELGNQLTMHFWGDDGPAAGGPSGPCATPRDEACDYMHPLNKIFIDPEPGEAIFFTIVNAQFLNLGYTVRLELSEFVLPPMPVFDEGAGFRFQPTTTSPQSPRTGPFTLDDLAVVGGQGLDGTDDPRTVLIPGPDGEMIEIELPIVAAAQRIDTPEERGVNPLLTALVVIVVLGALITYFTIRRRRQLREASPY